MANTLLNIGVGITLLGLVVGMPQLDTLLVDFTQFGTLTITLMRLGVTTVAFYFIAQEVN